MSAAENKRLLQHIFSHLAEGDAKPFASAMAETFRWTMIGSTAWSKTYEGKQTVLTELFGALRSQIDGRISTIAHHFYADGDHVVVEARGNNVTKAGIPYNNTYCFVFRLAGGQLHELTEYFDTELVTAALRAPGAE